MYSRIVVAEKLAAFKSHFGWMPEEHSPDEIDLFNKKLESLQVRDKSGDTYVDDSSLSPAIIHWIQNERAMVSIDAEYFLTRYAWLTENNIQRFTFRSGQRAFFRALQILEEKGTSQEFQILKARKQGISTITELLMTHCALYIPGARCSIGSADDQKTAVMMDMMYGALEMLPWYIRPTQTKDKRSGRALLQFARIGTSIVVQHGAMRGGIGQGTTPNKVHLCFAPETKIRVGNGKVLPAIDCQDNFAISGDGEDTLITAVTKSPRSGEVTANITPWGCYEPQITTLDHRVLTPQGIRTAGELHKGDEILLPVREITNSITDSPIFHRGTGRTNKPPREQKVRHDFNLGWVCGLYLAEGHLHVNKRLGIEVVDSLVFTMHEKEVDRNLSGLNRVLGDLHLKVIRRENSKTCQIRVCNAGWARWMEGMFGRVSGKHIPDKIFQMGQDFCSGLLKGYLEGDGHIPKDTEEVIASTIQEGMAYQLRDLSLSLGIGLPAMYHREAGVFYNRNCKPIWTLRWTAASSHEMRNRYNWPSHRYVAPKYWRYSDDKRCVYVVIRSAQRGFSETFYNVEVSHPSHVFCTPQMAVFNSEVCDYTNPEAQIEEGLFKAVPSMPDVLMVLESTGNGNTGWWAEQWRSNKEKYWQGRSRLLPLFLPWFMTPELYPTSHWLQKFPFPMGWKRSECPEAVLMADKSRSFVQSSPMLLEILGRQWTLPDEQFWYWQYHFEEAKARKMEKSWIRQMPVDDYDALIGENESSWDRDSVITLETRRQKSCQAYALIGDAVQEKHEPDPLEVEYSTPRVPIQWSTVNDVKLNWLLLPLRGDPEDLQFSPLKKLLVWSPPERGARYSIGVDTGFGKGGDRTVIAVNRYGSPTTPDTLVAEFASDDIELAEVYVWCMAVAAWYATFYEESDSPRFVIEQRRKYGDSCYNSLKWHGFRKHHHFRHYDRKTLRPIPSPNQQEGWWTNEWSRPMLLSTFKHAVETGWYVINSRFLLEEIEALEQVVGSSGKIRQDHRSGEHDDRVFAAAMAYFTFHDSDLMAEKSRQRYAEPEDSDILINYGPAITTVPNPGAEDFFSLYR